MSMYWILFIGIAVISYIVQNSLQSKFKKYSKMPLASGMGHRTKRFFQWSGKMGERL